MVWVTNVENYVKETNQHFGVGNAFFVNIPLLWHLLPKYFAINYFFNIALKTRSHFRFFKTTYWRCARKCKVGLLETLGNYCALQYAGRCCGKQHVR